MDNPVSFVFAQSQSLCNNCLNVSSAGGNMSDPNLYNRQPSQIVVYSVNWCPDCRRAKYFLIRRKIPYLEVDIDNDPTAADFVRKVNRGNRTVPTMIFPDGSLLVEPSNDELAKRFSPS